NLLPAGGLWYAERSTAPSWRLSDATDLAGAGNRQVEHRGTNQPRPGNLGQHCRGNRAIAADGEPARGSGPPPCRSPGESPGRHSLGAGRGRGPRSAAPMSLPVRFLPEARDEYDAAADYYEQQQAGLGVDFIARVREVLQRISANP